VAAVAAARRRVAAATAAIESWSSGPAGLPGHRPRLPQSRVVVCALVALAATSHLKLTAGICLWRAGGERLVRELRCGCRAGVMGCVYCCSLWMALWLCEHVSCLQGARGVQEGAIESARVLSECGA
jgi:hypothetical protein